MMTTDHIRLDVATARELIERACVRVGANAATTASLVECTLSAAACGPVALGFPHFVDYLESFLDGRINGDPRPSVRRPYPAFLAVDADKGVAQLAFNMVFDDFKAAISEYGIAVLTVANAYTTGELGYYLRKLSGAGVLGMAATNANAFMVANRGGPAVFSTNPIAFSFPMGDGSPPLIIDQSASATAYVNIVSAAARGDPIPIGWAVDKDGNETTNAEKAVDGALLPSGGRKGANLALMVEMMAAGLSGGNWSLDAPPYNSGSESPAVGLTVIAIMPGGAGDGLADRARVQVDRLRQHGVYVPNIGGREDKKNNIETIVVPRTAYEVVLRISEK